MFYEMQFYLGLCLFCLYLSVNAHITTLPDSFVEKKLNETQNNLRVAQPENDKTSSKYLELYTLTFESKMESYSEKNCRVTSSKRQNISLSGVTDDNSITYAKTLDKYFGQITILPDPNLHGFNINFGMSEMTDGLQFHFNDNLTLCKQESSIDESKSHSGGVCVQTYNLKRTSGTGIKACFIVGGASLTKKYFDINTINSYNGMSAAAIDLGCYRATSSDISYSQHTENDTLLPEALNLMTQPFHSLMCSSANHIIPIYAVSIIIFLKAVLNL